METVLGENTENLGAVRGENEKSQKKADQGSKREIPKHKALNPKIIKNYRKTCKEGRISHARKHA